MNSNSNPSMLSVCFPGLDITAEEKGKITVDLNTGAVDLCFCQQHQIQPFFFMVSPMSCRLVIPFSPFRPRTLSVATFRGFPYGILGPLALCSRKLESIGFLLCPRKYLKAVLVLSCWSRLRLVSWAFSGLPFPNLDLKYLHNLRFAARFMFFFLCDLGPPKFGALLWVNGKVLRGSSLLVTEWQGSRHTSWRW